MESEKTSKSAKGEAATTAQRQFTAERHSGGWAFVIFCNSKLVYKGLHVPRTSIFGRNEANTLSSTPLKEDLGCSGYLFTFLGFILSFFHCSSRFTMNMVN